MASRTTSAESPQNSGVLPLRRRAHGPRFDLNGGVGDIVVAGEEFVQVVQDDSAVREGLRFRHDNMTGKKIHAVRDRPGVQVMHGADVGHPAHCQHHIVEVQIFRRAFEQNIGRVAHDFERGIENEQRDEHGDGWVGVKPVGFLHGDSRENDAEGGKRVARHVDESRPHIQAVFRRAA